MPAETAPAETAGATPPNLLDALWPGGDIDVYVTRDLTGVRYFPCGPAGWGDAVWVHDPPAPPVCFFRLTAARMLGLANTAKRRKETLAAAESVRDTLDPAAAAALAERTRQVERDAETLKVLKAEFVARWPDVVKRLAAVVPEDMEDPARPSDAWAAAREPKTRTLATAPPPSPADAALAAWAATASAPAGAFRPTAYSVVLDGPAWLARLAAAANSPAPAARAAALDRLRTLRAAPPPPATEGDAATARALAARA